MKRKEIEPILKQMVDAMQNANKPTFKNIDYSHDETLEVMEYLLKVIVKPPTNLKNAGKPWTEKRTNRLIKMIINELDPYNRSQFHKDAAKRFKRTPNAISSQLKHMGITEVPYDPEYTEQQIEELKSSFSTIKVKDKKKASETW